MIWNKGPQGPFSFGAAVPAVVLVAGVAAVPGLTQGAYRLSDHDGSRLIQLGLLWVATLAAAATARGAAARGGPPSHAPSWLVSGLGWGLLLLGLASVAAADVPAQALREATLWLALSVTAWRAGGWMAEGRRLEAALVAVAAGAAAYSALLLILVAVSAAAARPVSWSALSVGYDNYRFFNHVQTVAVPLLVGAAAADRLPRLARAAALAAAAVFVAHAVVSGARGTALAWVGGSVLLALALPARQCLPLARAAGVAVLSGMALYAAAFHWLPGAGAYRLSEAAERSAGSLASDNARLTLWTQAAAQAAAHPWLGAGPQHFAHVPNPKAAHPHNVYVQVAAEWGLPWLALALTGCAVGLLRLARRLRRGGPAPTLGQGALAACTAALVDAAVSGNFVMPVSQMWIAFAAAVAIAWATRAAKEDGPAAGAADARAVRDQGLRVSVVACLASTFAMTWLVWHIHGEALDLPRHLDTVRRTIADNAKSNPRFWSHGWF